jgi:hypothetical protein
VIKLAGEETWRGILKKSGLPEDRQFSMNETIDDAAAMGVVKIVCQTLNITLEQAADAFGDYWMNDYAPLKFPLFFKKNKTARDFLNDISKIHDYMTRSMPGAQPPEFAGEWENKNTLVLHYRSHRGMIDFVVGLVKGTAKKYGETLTVEKTSDTTVKVSFPVN